MMHQKNSINYINGKYGSKIDIINCNFNNKVISNDTKFIDGKEWNQDSSKVSIKSCNFQKNSGNNQRNCNTKTSFLIVLSTIFVLFAIFALLIKKVNRIDKI